MSKIEWTDKTWNPITGCTKISSGCEHCYAITMSNRVAGIKSSPASKHYQGTVRKMAKGGLNWTGRINMIEERILDPFSWKKPTMVFVNSMSDLFHEDVTWSFLDKLFAVMIASDRHTFQILTKRADHMAEYCISRAEKPYRIIDAAEKINPKGMAIHLKVAGYLDAMKKRSYKWIPPNIWMGVSTENQQMANLRIPLLKMVPAEVRWLSCEPMLGHIDLAGKLEGLHWVVTGGESGPKARPAHPDWISDIRDQCTIAGTPFFFKQWGAWIPEVELKAIIEAGDHPKEFRPYKVKVVDRAMMHRTGKKNSGNKLEGNTHLEYPNLIHMEA